MENESEFHQLADDMLERLAEIIEVMDEDLLIDVDSKDAVLTLTLDSGDEFVVSKHAPSKQIWLSSPYSGGLHYDYNPSEECWESARNGSKLCEHLAKELNEQTGLRLSFAAAA